MNIRSDLQHALEHGTGKIVAEIVDQLSLRGTRHNASSGCISDDSREHPVGLGVRKSERGAGLVGRYRSPQPGGVVEHARCEFEGGAA